MLIADLTKVRWKEIQVRMEEVNLKGHIASQCLVGPQEIFHQMSVIVCSTVSQKIHTERIKSKWRDIAK